jgi:hypothetical protein
MAQTLSHLSGFSPAAGLKSGQFNPKRNLMGPQKIDVLAKALRRKKILFNTN